MKSWAAGSAPEASQPAPLAHAGEAEGKLEENAVGADVSAADGAVDGVDPDESPPGKADEAPGQPSLSNKQRKLAAKREKQKAQKAQAPPELGCQICHAKFPSRNQLFKHIAATGHAQLR